ncbi:hypothetical protein SALBM217S_08460 [Streptomyces griseoloalbus]
MRRRRGRPWCPACPSSACAACASSIAVLADEPVPDEEPDPPGRPDPLTWPACACPGTGAATGTHGTGPARTTTPPTSPTSWPESARTAVEVAAAGRHHLFLEGPPGAGKTMLAERLPAVLPRPARQESPEVTAVHSVAGLLPPGKPLIDTAPYCAPHHRHVRPGGGGPGVARPGAVSLVPPRRPLLGRNAGIRHPRPSTPCASRWRRGTSSSRTTRATAGALPARRQPDRSRPAPMTVDTACSAGPGGTPTRPGKYVSWGIRVITQSDRRAPAGRPSERICARPAPRSSHTATPQSRYAHGGSRHGRPRTDTEHTPDGHHSRHQNRHRTDHAPRQYQPTAERH